VTLPLTTMTDYCSIADAQEQDRNMCRWADLDVGPARNEENRHQARVEVSLVVPRRLNREAGAMAPAPPRTFPEM